MDIPKAILRKNIGIVLQDTKLFSGTIRDNITYGTLSVTDKEIELAAKKAHANSFIERLPQKYDTYITSNRFSEGETQLITIARTLLTSPPILILDEATSNIDLLTEYKIQQAFKVLIKNTTSFIIAHRLSTIESADLILYIENGNIAEKGTHKELLNKKGKYFELYHSQFDDTPFSK